MRALDGVELQLAAGEVLGLVGETGSGKSVTALSIMRLVPHPGRIASGEVLFEGRDLLQLSEPEMRVIRGGRIGMIFQDPMSSLNPVLRVGYQIAEAVGIHQNLSPQESRAVAIEMLKLVRIPAPELVAERYPFQLSGGARQRVMIAMALSCRPALLIADEATTNLDVTIQAQILDLMRKAQGSTGMAILLITHDMGIIAEMCDNAAVMYAGSIVEYAPIGELFENPLHPYTQALLRAIPRSDARTERLQLIPGSVPSLIDPPTGCRFHPRCPFAFTMCPQFKPPMLRVTPSHYVSCFLYGGVPA